MMIVENADMREVFKRLYNKFVHKPAVVEQKGCNRHFDCDEADAKVRAKGGFAASHCHDDCCEECFGY